MTDIPHPDPSVKSVVSTDVGLREEYDRSRADHYLIANLEDENERLKAGRSFQARVDDWLLACFGETIARDRTERNHRFIEEALELVQSGGCTRSEAHQLVDYVFDRPVGEMAQEVGGVMNTLAALCLSYGMDLDEAAERELARVWTKVDTIRAKQAAKPRHSPLPQSHASSAERLSQDLREENERLKAERDEARAIVRAIYWMALRYADGRMTFAVEEVNAAVRKGYDGGWLKHEHPTDPAFARDGMGDEWTNDVQRSSARAESAERLSQELREKLARAVEVLREGRRAIGDHFAPNDCYATGPLTGDHFRDLVECPACSFIVAYDDFLASLPKDGEAE